MSGNKPCCAAAAAAQVRYLTVGGHRVAIAQLDEIFGGADEYASGGENALRIELLRLVKIYNYVPPSAEKVYGDALYEEYLVRKGKGRGKEKGAEGK